MDKPKKDTPKTLGILGGLGPMATVYFYELVTGMTKADCDQDHINILLSSRAETPDRTAFILDPTCPDPTQAMVESAQTLERAGADILAMPCNTAHYFYDAIAKSVKIPMLNIIDETLAACSAAGARKIGILATAGTVASGTYPLRAEKFGMTCVCPDAEEQAIITSIIYDEIKKGKTPDMREFYKIANNLFARGCTAIVLGCTELSLLKKDYHLDSRYVDSLHALARATVLACGKELNG